MKLLLTILFTTCLTASATWAQSNQSPTMQQSTSTEDNRSANPARPKVQRQTGPQRRRMEMGLDSTLPKDRQRPARKQRKLRPDSLRRGGATRVDTVR